jgi:hypothetical protein
VPWLINGTKQRRIHRRNGTGNRSARCGVVEPWQFACEVRCMRRFLRDNGLSVTLFALFVISLVGQALAGWRAQAEELRLHELPAIGFTDYLASGHFISAVFENWESEFLQMAAYVLLTVFLFQKGSPESKRPDEPNPEDEPPHRRRGGRMHRHQSIGVVCC